MKHPNRDNKKEHKLKVYEIGFYLYSVDEKNKMKYITLVTQYVILTRFDKTDVQTFQNQFFHIMFIFHLFRVCDGTHSFSLPLDIAHLRIVVVR